MTHVFCVKMAQNTKLLSAVMHEMFVTSASSVFDNHLKIIGGKDMCFIMLDIRNVIAYSKHLHGTKHILQGTGIANFIVRFTTQRLRVRTPLVLPGVSP
jgi:hypothetical protein